MCLWVFVGTQTFSRRSSCPACPWSTGFNVCTYSWVLRCWWIFECSSGTRSPFWILMGACLSLWVIIGPPAVSLGFLLVLVGHCGAHVMVVRHCEFLWVLMGALGSMSMPTTQISNIFRHFSDSQKMSELLEIRVGRGGTYVGVLVVASAFSEVPPRASDIFRQAEMSDAFVGGRDPSTPQGHHPTFSRQ